MTDPDSDRHRGHPAEPEPGPKTRAELKASLDELLRAAHVNGVDVDDIGIDLRHEAFELPDWEVCVTRLRKPSTGDEED